MERQLRAAPVRTCRWLARHGGPDHGACRWYTQNIGCTRCPLRSWPALPTTLLCARPHVEAASGRAYIRGRFIKRGKRESKMKNVARRASRRAIAVIVAATTLILLMNPWRRATTTSRIQGSKFLSTMEQTFAPSSGCGVAPIGSHGVYPAELVHDAGRPTRQMVIPGVGCVFAH